MEEIAVTGYAGHTSGTTWNATFLYKIIFKKQLLTAFVAQFQKCRTL